MKQKKINGRSLLAKMMPVKKVFTALLVATALAGAGLYAQEVKVIKDPLPNMTEKRYIQLEETGTIDEDLGNDEFLFSPYSVTTDKDKNVYVYDNMQTRIFKLDKHLKLLKSFGGKGIGPGEFNGGASRNPVPLNIGADGLLYANNFRGFKVISFTTEGKFVKEYRYGKGNWKVRRPIMDTAGNLYIFTLDENDTVVIRNQHKQPFVTFGHVRDVFSFLVAKPGYLEHHRTRRHRHNLASTVVELSSLAMTPSGKVLVFFSTSSTLYVLDKGKIIHKCNLLPKDALEYYKESLPKEMKKSKDMIKTLFYNLFADDEEEAFYLQMGRNEKKGINALYKFDLKGKLLNVLYMPDNGTRAFTMFRAKHNGTYLAIKDEKITKYKEKQQ